VYAVFRDRGRQFSVRQGDTILCDDNGAWTAGDEVRFDEVLLLSSEGKVQVGKPTVGGAAVTGEVVGAERGDKLVVMRFKRRKGIRVKSGHRQTYTRVRITGIQG
jgi:large subunit ribosomal protein L21